MFDSEETLKQEPTIADVIKSVIETNNKLDVVIRRLDEHDKPFKVVDVQLESIREGIVHNGVAFDRLQSVVYNIRADVRELAEEVRKDNLALK